jgi:putative radical SAM enzyme (TIGR03279 family)
LSVKIIDTLEGSFSRRHGIKSGETLVSINGHEIDDVLDFRFYETDSKLLLIIENSAGGQREVALEKPEYSELGMVFETYLMDKQRSCRNNCVFCFIDQLPHGLRDTLYFKDDDSRLSFLFGNYITLTNITDREIDRIIKMRISPINISVHTMNPELRVRMMKNRWAGDALEKLRRLSESGVEINCQLVLCPDFNDKEELDYSLRELLALPHPVNSVSLVPVGLTRHRENLEPLRLFTKEECLSVITAAEHFAARSLEKFGRRIIYASDEFYLKAGLPLPEEEYYEDYAQLENGVGMVTLMRSDVRYALSARSGDSIKRTVTAATGVSAAAIIAELLAEIKLKYTGLDYEVIAVENRFFGESITVAGLVTGGDLIEQLRGVEFGERLLIPRSMLRSEGDLFLDDVSLTDAQNALGVEIVPVSNDGEEFVSAVLGEG